MPKLQHVILSLSPRSARESSWYQGSRNENLAVLSWRDKLAGVEQPITVIFTTRVPMRRIEYYTWSTVKYCITYNSHHIPHSWTYRDGHYALAVAIKWQWQVDTLVQHRPILRSRKSYFCQRLSFRKTIKMWFSISCVCKIIFRRRVMSYVIKVSLFFLCGERKNLHNQQNGI